MLQLFNFSSGWKGYGNVWKESWNHKFSKFWWCRTKSAKNSLNLFEVWNLFLDLVMGIDNMGHSILVSINDIRDNAHCRNPKIFFCAISIFELVLYIIFWFFLVKQDRQNICQKVQYFQVTLIKPILEVP